MTANEKLTALRKLMREHHIDAYMIGSGDAHQSEYVTDYWRARAWLSGFTGSNGLVALTAEDAGLWTDGRYFIQAEKQLAGSGITLYKMNEEGVPTYREWLAEKIPANGTLGFDGRTVSITEFDKLKKELKHSRFDCTHDLAGDIWTDRPSLPDAPVFEHELHFAGVSRTDKLRTVRDEMRKKEVNAYLLASLDDIAWLLNIRGRDIPQTPVAYAYACIAEETAHLFIAPAKVGEALKDKLTNDGYTLHAYDEIVPFLQALTAGTVLLFDAERINTRLAEAIPEVVIIKHDMDIPTTLKAVKNPVEQANIRNAHIKEGVVMARFLKWLDDWAADENREVLTEAGLHGVLTHFREQQEHYLEPSFDTIAAYGENAASMHYSPVADACSAIQPEGFLLVDTGAQYLDGTTDITRTIVMGAITDEMKRDYTLVLKGHIALASAVFMYGATGTQLDTFARAPLWAAGMNYRSGTGHGLGYCLGVHEGPQNISTRQNPVKLTAGMLCTNEPGVYKEGRYGIRTENVLLVKELFKNEDGTFMGFDTVSFCPIDKRAIDLQIMTPQEIQWLNTYHACVYDKLSAYLSTEEKVWLKQATSTLIHKT